MKNSFVAFIAGAGIGSAVTYIILRKKFDELNAKEIAEVKAMYVNRSDDDGEVIKFEDKMNEAMTKAESQEDIAKKAVNKKDIMNYNKIVQTEYTKKEEKEVNIDAEIELYPDDFGEDNEVIYATHYEDGYVIDDDDHMVDIDLIGGKETLEHIGEGDNPDILQVRSNTYNLDYEIVFDDRTYAEVSGKDVPDISEED